MKRRVLILLLLLSPTLLFGANVRTAQLDNGLVTIDVNGSGKNMTFTVTNNEQSLTALFNVFNANQETDGNGVSWAPGTLIVWSYSQAPQTTGTQPVPTTDNFGQPINWVVGSYTNPKTGAVTTTVTSPPWQLTMQ